MSSDQMFVEGIEISPSALINARPGRAVTGFAPGGRVTTHVLGANRSIFHGRGMEYADSRMYQPGDELKTIDWRLTARSSDVYTKLYHEERERPVFILLDLRRMMRFGTRKRFKSHLAAEIAAMLAWVGFDGGDRVGGFVLTTGSSLEFPAARTRKSILHFLQAVSNGTRVATADDTREVPLHTALHKLRLVCRPGTLAFVISGFSDYRDETETELLRLSGRAHLTLIFTHDPLDARLPPRGGGLSDGHNVVDIHAMTGARLDQHAAAFAARQASLQWIARKCGMAFLRVQTPDDPKMVLHPGRIGRSARRALRDAS